MTHVRLRGPLMRLAGGAEHALPGSTVAAVLRELERAEPGLRGWILDERGLVRRHINVFVNGEQASGDTRLDGDGDRIDVLPAISGGA